jgi:predicted RNA-binding protein with PIN domain
VVDGDNVVGSRPDGWWRDRAGAKRRLVERLERFAAARDVPVTVVFDGRAIDAGRPGGAAAATDRPSSDPQAQLVFRMPCP